MAVCVRSEAVCDQTCFRELHTARWSAIGAEEILEGCGIRMVPQDQKASAVSLTKFNHCLNVTVCVCVPLYCIVFLCLCLTQARLYEQRGRSLVEYIITIT